MSTINLRSLQPGARLLAVCAVLLMLVSPAQAVQPESELSPGWVQAEELLHVLGMYGWAQCPEQPEIFYVIGGAIAASSPVNYLQRYNATSGDWTGLTDLPIPLLAAAATCYQGRLYVAGGYAPAGITNLLYIYDIAGDAWSSGANLPRHVMGAAMGVFAGKLYLAGGTPLGDPWIPVNQVDVYDIARNTWEIGPTMPAGATSPGSVTMGRYLYVVGGWSGNFNANINATQRLDMATGIWQQGPNFASRRAGLALPATQSRLYAIGGDSNFNGLSNPSSLVESLDLLDWPGGGWALVADPMPIPLAGNNGSFCTQALAGGEVWSVGGYDSDIVVTDTVQYLPAEPCFTPFYALNLLPASDSAEVYPSETHTYTISLENSGHIEDSYDVSVASIWPVSAPATLGPLEPGQIRWFHIAVQVPPGAAPRSSDEALVIVTSQGDPTLSAHSTLTTTALSECGVILQPPNLESVATAGYTVTYTLRLTNTGRVADGFDLGVSGNTWPVSLPLTQVALAPGAGADVQAAVSIPPGALEGESDTVTLSAVSQCDPLQTDSATLLTKVIQHGVTLEPPSKELSGDPGETITYTLRMTNTGNLLDTFDLAYSGNTWVVSLPVTQTTLAAGAGIDLDVLVDIPASARAGSADSVMVTATSLGDPDKTDASILATIAATIYRVDLDPDELALSALQGETVTYTLRLTNTGNITDTIDLGISGNVWPSLVPIKQTLLAPGAGLNLEIQVSVPLGAPGGAVDTITVTAVSQGDPSQVEEATLTTTVLWFRLYLPVVLRQ